MQVLELRTVKLGLAGEGMINLEVELGVAGRKPLTLKYD